MIVLIAVIGADAVAKPLVPDSLFHRAEQALHANDYLHVTEYLYAYLQSEGDSLETDSRMDVERVLIQAEDSVAQAFKLAHSYGAMTTNTSQNELHLRTIIVKRPNLKDAPSGAYDAVKEGDCARCQQDLRFLKAQIERLMVKYDAMSDHPHVEAPKVSR